MRLQLSLPFIQSTPNQDPPEDKLNQGQTKEHLKPKRRSRREPWSARSSSWRIFSSGQCQDTDPSRDPDASLAVCKSDIRDLGVHSAQILELQRLIQEQAQQLMALKESTLAAVPRMAFTAAVGHSLGPVPIDITVKYQMIISNMGNGYNPTTGIFTARVSGMYYFRYTMYNNVGPTPNSFMSLMKNGQRLVSTWDTTGDDSNDSASNAAVLQLEAGDDVYTLLYANRQIYDDVANYNTFSGFLLFPL
ncbi:complement C1q-like protein 3 [Gadus chalcogrammus]|uniref:complement C1q-like protein 3 n=1 Tax=Gadus chalcogrammus TaxID=1042646 RepID=UPI0024C4C0F4|nr:complement C1q-like protein 3 [Gadus chalcogrammus]